VSDVPEGDEMAVADFRPGEIVLEIPAGKEYVSMVRSVVAAAAEIEPDMGPDRIEDLRLVVSEATTNAIEAHGLHGVVDRIRIQCNLADDEVVVLVHDEGMGFDPDTVADPPEPDAPDRLDHESGLGVHLMQLLADESEFHSDDSGTDVKLVLYSSKRHRRASDR
jgi:serine/threonine-protein kinase RsbW